MADKVSVGHIIKDSGGKIITTKTSHIEDTSILLVEMLRY